MNGDLMGRKGKNKRNDCKDSLDVLVEAALKIYKQIRNKKFT